MDSIINVTQDLVQLYKVLCNISAIHIYGNKPGTIGVYIAMVTLVNTSMKLLPLISNCSLTLMCNVYGLVDVVS